MKNKSFESVKKTLADYFERHPEIEVAYIFGSVAQRKSSELSDIDLAILVDRQQVNETAYRYGYKAEIITDLIRLLKTNKVDLVILNEANTLLKHRVLYNGKLIHSKNESKRIQFQTSTIDKYVDFKEIIKPHRKTGVLN
jgi:uncharacterized protein